jgi:hypothetical protein
MLHRARRTCVSCFTFLQFSDPCCDVSHSLGFLTSIWDDPFLPLARHPGSQGDLSVVVRTEYEDAAKRPLRRPDAVLGPDSRGSRRLRLRYSLFPNGDVIDGRIDLSMVGTEIDSPR